MSLFTAASFVARDAGQKLLVASTIGSHIEGAKQDPATVIRTRDLRWSLTDFQLQTFALTAELWLGGMHSQLSISFKTQSICIDPRSRVCCASAILKEVFISIDRMPTTT